MPDGGPQRVDRKRAERRDGHRADADALVAHRVDDFLDGPVDRSQRDDDRLGVVRTVRAQQATGGAPEALLELVGELRNQLQRAQLLVVREIAHFHERFRPDHRAHADRLGRIQHLARLEGRQVGIDLALGRHIDALDGMGQDEAVHADHHRTRQRLRQAEGLDMKVQRFLVGLGMQLDPAGIAHGHAVRVVIPDVDRGPDRAIADRHHDRQAEPGCVVDRLGHEEQPLAAGRGVGAGAGCRSTDGDRKRRELRLDVDELATAQLADFTISPSPSTIWVWGVIG